MKMDCYRLGISICAYPIPIEVGPPRKTHFSHFGLPGRQVGVESSSGVELQPLPPPARHNRAKNEACGMPWPHPGPRVGAGGVSSPAPSLPPSASKSASAWATLPSQSMAPRMPLTSWCPIQRTRWTISGRSSADQRWWGVTKRLYGFVGEKNPNRIR